MSTMDKQHHCRRSSLHRHPDTAESKPSSKQGYTPPQYFQQLNSTTWALVTKRHSSFVRKLLGGRQALLNFNLHSCSSVQKRRQQKGQSSLSERIWINHISTIHHSDKTHATVTELIHLNCYMKELSAHCSPVTTNNKVLLHCIQEARRNSLVSSAGCHAGLTSRHDSGSLQKLT